MCSGSSSPIGQHIASTIILLSFFIPTVINHYLHIVQEERQEKEGYTKLALPLDIIKMKLSKGGWKSKISQTLQTGCGYQSERPKHKKSMPCLRIRHRSLSRRVPLLFKLDTMSHVLACLTWLTSCLKMF